jgi:hypothetical protein
MPDDNDNNGEAPYSGLHACPEKIDCDDRGLLLNYSAEYIELREWYSTAYGADGCIERCASVVSQEEADLCAQRQLAMCVNGEDSDDPTTTSLYGNEAQECTVACPDGTTFTAYVAADTFFAQTLAEANAQAASYACLQAPLRRFCLGPLTQCCCANETFDGSLDIDGTDNLVLSVGVTSGTLPDGLSYTLDGLAIRLTGTPTVAGNYQFTLSATDQFGNHADGTYDMSVYEVDSASLPDFELGVPYNYQLVANGGSGNYAWRMSSGTLPDGMELTIDGLLTGTPMSAGAGPIEFEVLDTDCTEADQRFFVPKVSMSTSAVTTVATVRGFPAYIASTPPKRYKRLEFSGTSAQFAYTWATSEICGRAKYEWSGASLIDSAGTLLSRYAKRFYAACPSATQWPRNTLLPRIIESLKGYCWPTDPNSCPTCADPPVYVRDTSGNNIWDDARDLYDGKLQVVSATQAQRVGAGGGPILLRDVVGVPYANVNGIDGPWALVEATHNFTATLSDEYTDAEALANAYVYATNGSTAENKPRTTGLVSTFTDVGFRLTCTQLLPGSQYTARVILYNTTTNVSTPVTYTFTAAGTTHTITGTIPTPAAGQAVQVKSPSISYA